ncbi:MAG TPA: DUF502 domain-containing protein [Cyclobacteriaceae bacterium]
MKDALRKFMRYFFSGTLFIVPLTATAYVIFIGFSWLDSLLNLTIPGIGFVIIIGAITIFGYLTSTYAFQTFTEVFDVGMNRIPFIKLIYSSLKDLLSAFVGEKKKFDKPVLVTINKENSIYQVGFVTQGDLSDLGLSEMVTVYFPHSYAISGNHFLVPKTSIKPLQIPGPTAMKFIVSGGVSGFKEYGQ